MVRQPVRMGIFTAALLLYFLSSINRAQCEWIRHNPNSRGVVIFVHGLFGDARTTWTAEKTHTYWPEMLLNDPLFKDQDVYVLQYQSSWSNQGFSIDQLADKMRLELQSDGVLSHKHIIIVSHSMGGVLTRAFILRYRPISAQIRFLYFLATPTTGNSLARIASLFSKNAQVQSLLSLNQPGTYLAQQQSDWLAADLHLKSYCAYETKPLDHLIVVERDSATNLCSEHLSPIDADHRSIAKPESPSSESYRALKEAIMETPLETPKAKGMPTKHVIQGKAPIYGNVVSMLALQNVGASPTSKEIPDPPRWKEPSKFLQLSFKNSPILTPTIEKGITRDLSAFREYLTGYGLELTDKYPPIGIVDNAPGSTQAHTSDNKPLYRSEENISAGWILDRREITAGYSYYLLADFLRNRTEGRESASMLADMQAASAFSKYFNWSFWSDGPAAREGLWDAQLWNLRQQFGDDYTDRLVAYALKIMRDTPQDILSADFNVYCFNALREAAKVVDSEPELRIATIREIIERSGIDLSIKPELNFNASATENSKGAIAISVSIQNDTGMMVPEPTIDFYVPEARLSGEIQSPTERRAHRAIRLASIAAHKHKVVEFEIVPFSKIESSFLLSINYSCKNCAQDIRDHTLVFDLKD
jgi:pimeloyl-ACP methyl ester carboxylesterase